MGREVISQRVQHTSWQWSLDFTPQNSLCRYFFNDVKGSSSRTKKNRTVFFVITQHKNTLVIHWIKVLMLGNNKRLYPRWSYLGKAKLPCDNFTEIIMICWLFNRQNRWNKMLKQVKTSGENKMTTFVIYLIIGHLLQKYVAHPFVPLTVIRTFKEISKRRCVSKWHRQH